MSHSPHRLQALRGVLALLLLALVLGVPTASAQTTAVCSNTPPSSQRIECVKDTTSTDNIEINTQNQTISTTGADRPAVKANHKGTGNIVLRIRNRTPSRAAGGWRILRAHRTTASGRISRGRDRGRHGQRHFLDHYDGCVSPDRRTSRGGQGVRVDSRSSGTVDVDIRGGSITASGHEYGDGVSRFSV